MYGPRVVGLHRIFDQQFPVTPDIKPLAPYTLQVLGAMISKKLGHIAQPVLQVSWFITIVDKHEPGPRL